MPIQVLAGSQLKASELGSCGRDISTILKKWSFEDEIIKVLSQDLSNQVFALEDRSGVKSRKNPLSDPLNLAHKERCGAHGEVYKHVKGKIDDMDPVIREAALKAYALFVEHNPKICSLSRDDASHSINALLIDINKDEFAEARKILIIDAGIAKMGEKQKAYDTLKMQKVEMVSASSRPKLSTYVKPLIIILEQIISHLNILEGMHPEIYKQANSEINEVVAALSIKLQARQTRKSNAETKKKGSATTKKNVDSKPADTKTVKVDNEIKQAVAENNQTYVEPQKSNENQQELEKV